ncbi:transcriptional regulator with XRE-family HTH domain [Rahnella sp. BIGb0603]|uniref:lambda phage CII family protein n=1 Tax=Rahnella sp. BIGb0603 TaxID=2940612 RepID=UPI00216749A0|nr:lambda phage CII family protein [Rahnella sp. BIGb0603]MCS3423413.1 transcriptional regulator with XRE-family HTH domain [Rahnella sp. BIGb0603]
MEVTTTRNKARVIESQLLNKIAVRGVTEVAAAIGVDKSQVSRWKEAFIPRMSMLLAVLEWGVVDDDLARLAKEVAKIFTKQKAPAVTEASEQITMSF